MPSDPPSVPREITAGDTPPPSGGWSAALRQAILDNGPALTCVLSLDGRILEAGCQTLAELGFGSDQARHDVIWKAPIWRSSAEAAETVRAAFLEARQGRRAQVIVASPGADSSRRWVELTFGPVVGSAGQTLSVTAFGQD